MRNFSVPSGYIPRGSRLAFLSRPMHFWMAQIKTISLLSPLFSLFHLFVSKSKSLKSASDGLDVPSRHHVVPTRHWKFSP